jgi:hypothetical protein
LGESTTKAPNKGDSWAQSFVLRFAQASPRNLTGSDGRLRKDKRQKKNMQKAGVRWVGVQKETHNSCVHLQRVYYTQGQTRRWSNSSQGSMTLQLLGTRGTCDCYSGCKHLRKNSSAAFCLGPLLWLRLCQLSLQII